MTTYKEPVDINFEGMFNAISYGALHNPGSVLPEFIDNCINTKLPTPATQIHLYKVSYKSKIFHFIYNNGSGMNREDIRKAFKMFSSRKREPGDIGYWGLGLKSSKILGDNLIVLSKLKNNNDIYSGNLDMINGLQTIEVCEEKIRDYTNNFFKKNNFNEGCIFIIHSYGDLDNENIINMLNSKDYIDFEKDEKNSISKKYSNIDINIYFNTCLQDKIIVFDKSKKGVKKIECISNNNNKNIPFIYKYEDIYYTVSCACIKSSVKKNLNPRKITEPKNINDLPCAVFYFHYDDLKGKRIDSCVGIERQNIRVTEKYPKARLNEFPKGKSTFSYSDENIRHFDDKLGIGFNKSQAADNSKAMNCLINNHILWSAMSKKEIDFIKIEDDEGEEEEDKEDKEDEEEDKEEDKEDEEEDEEDEEDEEEEDEDEDEEGDISNKKNIKTVTEPKMPKTDNNVKVTKKVNVKKSIVVDTIQNKKNANNTSTKTKKEERLESQNELKKKYVKDYTDFYDDYDKYINTEKPVKSINKETYIMCLNEMCLQSFILLDHELGIDGETNQSFFEVLVHEFTGLLIS
jgi:hypothetical protein